MKRALLNIIAICVAVCVYAGIAPAATPLQDKVAGEIVSTKMHAEMELSCEDCHNTPEPAKRAPASSCKNCHENKDGTYKGILDDSGKPMEKAYPEGTSTKSVNFHNSHQGELRCTVCHATHQAPVLYCNECHEFKVPVK